MWKLLKVLFKLQWGGGNQESNAWEREIQTKPTPLQHSFLEYVCLFLLPSPLACAFNAWCSTLWNVNWPLEEISLKCVLTISQGKKKTSATSPILSKGQPHHRPCCFLYKRGSLKQDDFHYLAEFMRNHVCCAVCCSGCIEVQTTIKFYSSSYLFKALGAVWRITLLKWSRSCSSEVEGRFLLYL